jgi:hypothetical protein
MVQWYRLGCGDTEFVRIVTKRHDDVPLLIECLRNGGGIKGSSIGINGVDRVALAPIVTVRRIRGSIVQYDDLRIGQVKDCEERRKEKKMGRAEEK